MANMFLKKLLIALLCFLSLSNSFSQWTKLDFAGSRNVHSIYFDNESTYIGTDEVLFYNETGLWENTTVEHSFYNFNFSEIRGILIKDDQWFVSGFAVNGNSILIPYKSTNSSSWSQGYTSSSGSWPRAINELKYINETFYAISSNGYLYTSSNGTTWSPLLLSYGVNLINMTHTGDNIIISSSNKITTSTNGGGLFITSNFEKEIAWIEYINETTAMLATTAGELMTSTDFGLTWNAFETNLPQQYALDQFDFVTEDTVYAYSNNEFLRSTDGGVNWEKKTFDFEINRVEFKNKNEGYVLGDLGNIYYTTNGGGDYEPIANFKPTKELHCADSTIYLLSLSPTATHYQWFHNGKLKSNSPNFNFIGKHPGENDTIKLVVNKGEAYDTIQKLIPIEASLYIDFNAELKVDSVCLGSTNEIYFRKSSRTATYWISNYDSTFVSDQKKGTNYDMSIRTDKINDHETYKIYMINTVESCGTIVQEDSIFIPNGSPDRTLNVFSEPAVICPNQQATIKIENSEPGIQYRLFNTSQVGSTVIGTGQTISFEKDNYPSDPQYRVVARNNTNYCMVDLFEKGSVKVENPKAYFSIDDLTLFSDETPVIKNNSKNSGGTYQWTITPDASPATSQNETLEPLSFANTGNKKITLVAISPNGCTDTLKQEMNIITRNAPETCVTTQFENSGYSGGPESLIYDKDGNLFMGTSTFGELRNGDYSKIYTSENDIIQENYKLIRDYEYENYIFKLDVNGQVIWKTKFTCGSTWSEDTRLTTDEAGNLYMSYSHADHLDSVRFYSVDGSSQTFEGDPPCEQNCGNNDNAFFVAKWSPDGFLQWVKYFHDYYTASRWDDRQPLFVGDHERLYVATERNLVIYTLDGEKVYRSRTVAPEDGGISAFIKSGATPDATMAIRNEAFIFEEYDTLGNRISDVKTVNFVNDPNINTYLSNRYVKRDDEAIYIAGDFSGSFVFNGDTITDIYTGGNLHRDAYLAKFSLTGEPIWIRHFVNNQGNVHFLNGLAVSNDKIFIYLDGGGDLIFPDGSVHNTNDSYHLFIEFDKDGTITKNGIPFQGVIQGRGRGKDNLAYDPTNGRLAFFQHFSEDFMFGGKSIKKGNSQSNYIIVQTNTECLDLNDVITTTTSNLTQLASSAIYPNPVSNNLSIALVDKGQIINLKVVDSKGVIQKMGNINDVGSALQLNTSELAQGVYFIQFFQNGKQFSGKFVKN